MASGCGSFAQEGCKGTRPVTSVEDRRAIGICQGVEGINNMARAGALTGEHIRDFIRSKENHLTGLAAGARLPIDQLTQENQLEGVKHLKWADPVGVVHTD